MYKVYLQKGPRIRSDKELNSMSLMLKKASQLVSRGIEPTEMDRYDYSGMKTMYLVEGNKCVIYISLGLVTELGFDETKEHDNLILLEDFATKENYYGSTISYKSNAKTLVTMDLLYKKGKLILYEDDDDLLVLDYLKLPFISHQNMVDNKYSDYDYVLEKLQKQIDNQGLSYKLK